MYKIVKRMPNSSRNLSRGFILVGILSLLLLWTVSAFSAEAGVDSIDWFALGMGLFGGLALFLSGLDMLSEGLKKAAGDTLKHLLSKMTSNRLLGALTGAFVTAVLNSSSVTTVLVVSFITAGVMSLPQSVGVIMGANIGSTMTAQLLAFNISAYALLPIAIGFFMTFTAKRDQAKYFGMMLMGLGLVFYGMNIMSSAMTPLRSYQPFMELLESMERPLLGIVAGAVFTGLVQSSAATVGIAIAMATEGLLSLEAGIALALGANIGTCVTALMAAMGKPVEAVRAAIVHVLFNIVGVLVWLPFIGLLADIAVTVSPQSDSLSGIARAAAEVPRQIANANTLFNIINTLLFIGFAGWFARLAKRLRPDVPEKAGVIIEPKFLDISALSVPSVALEQVRQEFGRMGDVTSEMFSALPEAMLERSKEHVDAIVKLDDKVDILEGAIFQFLGKLRQESLTQEESRVHQNLMTATVNLETLADVIETDVSSLAKQFLEAERGVSDTTRTLFRRLYSEVQEAVELSVRAVRDNDQLAATAAVKKKFVITELSENLLTRKSEHLGHDQLLKLETSRLEISVVDKLRHCFTLAKRIAKVALPREIEDKV